MSARHYRLPIAVAASLSLTLSACGSGPAKSGVEKVATNTPPAGIDTDATIWTVLGLANEHPHHEPGPKTGPRVNPILWQAAHDTLGFVKFASQDPQSGVIVTHWYSPPDRPDERFKLNVFILSRVLRSDSIMVTVRHQRRSAGGAWIDVSGDVSVANALDTAILNRARVLRHKWFPHAAGNH